MAFRTKRSYSTPSGTTVIGRQGAKTSTAKRAPVGTKKIKAPTAATVPTVTTSSTGRVSTRNFPSPRAAQVAHKQTSSSQRRVRRIERQQASALGFHRRMKERASEPTLRTQGSHAKLTSLGVAPEHARPASLRQSPSYKPPKFQGAKTAGTPTLRELQSAKQSGVLRTGAKGFVTTPAVRKTAGVLKRLESKAAAASSPLPGLTAQQSKVARTVLRRGVKAGATRKEKLAAAETGLVESHFENLPGGDADSEGWRQERTSIYGTGPTGPRNVKASADRFYGEIRSDPGAATAPTAGMAAQAAQGSAFPERYDKVRPQANAILKGFEHGGLKPGQQRKLMRAKAQAQGLGLKVGSSRKVVTVPGKGRYVFPFPANKGWSWSRTDMGTDFAYSKEGAPIRALGSGIVTKTGAPGWPGEGGVLLKLDHAKGLPSPYVYVYEGVVPTVSAGQRVKRGQLVARGGITGSIEIGFADSNGQALASSEYTEGMVTKYGQAATNLLHMVQSGKTKIPVELLSVGGTLLPHSGGTVVSSAGTPEATLAPSSARKGKAAQAPGKALSPAQKAHRTLKKLDQVGAGLSEKPPEGSESKASVLKELEARYGSKAA